MGENPARAHRYATKMNLKKKCPLTRSHWQPATGSVTGTQAGSLCELDFQLEVVMPVNLY